MMHINSISAYAELRDSLQARQKEALDQYVEHGPLTDREVMWHLGKYDPNIVRPRITALLDRGILTQLDSVKCSVTGRTVRRCKYNPITDFEAPTEHPAAAD